MQNNFSPSSIMNRAPSFSEQSVRSVCSSTSLESTSSHSSFTAFGMHSSACSGNVDQLITSLRNYAIHTLAKTRTDNLPSPEQIETKMKQFVDVRNRSGLTALHGAAFHGRLNAVQALLELGSDVNTTAILPNQKRISSTSTDSSRKGPTALHFACINGYDDIVKVLLLAGADPTIRDYHGCLALDIARLHKRPKCFRLLNSACYSVLERNCSVSSENLLIPGCEGGTIINVVEVMPVEKNKNGIFSFMFPEREDARELARFITKKINVLS